jgi:hypothetical protein
MKKTGKITKVRLEIDPKEDFSLFGLVSSEPDYRLSLAINRMLSVSLRNAGQVVCSGENGEEVSFSRFSDKSREEGLSISLVSNRSGSAYLIRKLKNIDFLLHIHDPGASTDFSSIAARLRELPAVTGVFSIDPASVKDRNISLVLE